MSGTKHKRKGDRLERAVVALLKTHGIKAKRVPPSGSARGFPGDVVAVMGGLELVIECKSRRDFKVLYNGLQGRDALIPRGDRREAFIMLRLKDLLRMVKG